MIITFNKLVSLESNRQFVDHFLPLFIEITTTLTPGVRILLGSSGGLRLLAVHRRAQAGHHPQEADHETRGQQDPLVHKSSIFFVFTFCKKTSTLIPWPESI
jgi:hypothetical protein